MKSKGGDNKWYSPDLIDSQRGQSVCTGTVLGTRTAGATHARLSHWAVSCRVVSCRAVANPYPLTNLLSTSNTSDQGSSHRPSSTRKSRGLASTHDTRHTIRPQSLLPIPTPSPTSTSTP
jgi:hypothetical protein